VRRSSDGVTADFFSNSAGALGLALDASGTTANDWLDGATAYIATWYDQSGSGRHATQASAGNQPTLNLGLRVVDMTNGGYFNLPSGTVPMNIAYTVILRHGQINVDNGGFYGAGIAQFSSANNLRLSGWSYVNYWWSNDAGYPSNVANNNVVSLRYDGPTTAGTTHFFLNGAELPSPSYRSGWAGVAGNECIGKTVYGELLYGQLYDIFFYAASLSDADRTSVEAGLSSFIPPPPPA